MTDLAIVLPTLATQPYAHLIPSLEKHHITTTDLLTLDGVEIAKRAQLPILDVKGLCRAVLQHLHNHLGLTDAADQPSNLRKTGPELLASWNTISTLDEAIDVALGGGIPTGYVTEVTGESGAGKTQFLLGLLLAVQLPPPHGLSRSALYISTESALPTTRLAQMLKEHPLLRAATPRCSLDRVISIVTPDLESQDHILHYQLPVAIRRHKVGLVVLDSVAANYRAEFERPGASRDGANMAKRSSELVRLGQLLRELARTENLAVVVANQVADRFNGPSIPRGPPYVPPSTQSSLLAYRSGPAPLLPSSNPAPPSSLAMPLATPRRPMDVGEAMTLDHQQRWFTGWGDDARTTEQKTPSLGLIWTTQIACRIALIKEPVYVDDEGAGSSDDQDGKDDRGHDELPSRRGGEKVLHHWRRWMKVVFAPWVAPTGPGVDGAVEFTITSAGIRRVGGEGGEDRKDGDES